MDSQNKTQREIKFRAWDKTSKKMTKHFGYGKGYMCGGDGISLNDLISSEQYYQEIMQFTDIHDRHGIEIYDGDIVEFDYQDHPKRRKAYVEWNGQCYGLEAFVGDDTSYAPLFTQYTKALEVIGNIYESEDNDRGHPS